MRDLHERFRAALPAHLAEVLPAHESAWFDEHARQCDDCRRLLTQVQGRLPELAEAGEHAPPALLSAWLREPDSFTLLEQRLLMQHVANCDDCRADLEEMGRFTGLVPRLGATHRQSRPWRAYGTAVLLAAAALIAVFLVRTQRPDLASRSTATNLPLGSASQPVGTVPAPRLVFPDRMRGGGSNLVVVDTLRGPVPRVNVRLPLLFLGSADSVRLLVLRDGGKRIVDRRLSTQELQQELELSPLAGNWAVGEYELRVIPLGASDTSAVRRFRFGLVPAGR